MTGQCIKILLIEDNPADADLLQEILETADTDQLHLTHVDLFSKAVQYLCEHSVDVILLDFSLPDARGLVMVRRLYKIAPNVPIIVLTGLNDEETAIEAVREGAQDYLVKGTSFLSPSAVSEAKSGNLLVRTIRYAIEREQLIEQLRQSEERCAQGKELAQVTLQSIGDAVITTDAAGQVKSLNPIAEKLTGWQVRAAKGKLISTVFKIIDSDTREPLDNPAATVLQTGQSASLSNYPILISRTGQEFVIGNTATPIRTSDGQIMGAVLVFHDVTEEQGRARQLSWQANHDALTGLFNRQKFNRCLEQAANDARYNNLQHVLCYLDLDHFKIVNDTCGHVAGDELLRQVAALLQSKVRKTDILARLGGDEFGLLLYDCPLEQALRVTNTLCESLQKFRFAWQDKVFAIGVSIGLVKVEANTPNLDSVMRVADSACYAAKNKGRNRVHLYQADDQELAQQSVEVQWFSRLTQALEDNRFCLYYQAISPISSDLHVKQDYEILLRLVDETGQLVPPMAFIPPAERYNLMPKIDRWVIRTFFNYLASILESESNAPDFRSDQENRMYTVNLSGASVNDDEFVDFLKQQFLTHKIPPQLICFEITETVAIANLPQAAELIRELKDLGCRFALDDFGSGMSSLTYLKNLPVDYLKIDGNFIKDITDDPIACAMVQAINNIGHVMGLKTIAEFVADIATLNKVKTLGVDYVQGYGIAKPQPLRSSGGLICPINWKHPEKTRRPCATSSRRDAS
ncbi:MAG: EAL domain-containing protein [Cyanothece sp. SIO1E1]|nr:EAL domain-containing protein [Cyanothece sp. SIO1E1]